MRRMERITGLGDAATGLVHESSPLTALSIHIQLLEERMAESAAPEGTAELIGVLKAEADRLNNALDGFWDYAASRDWPCSGPTRWPSWNASFN